MTTNPAVAVLDVDLERSNPFGPATIEHRTAQAGFEELGTYVMTFNEDGHADPWTLQYEEVIYVISGEASILVEGDEQTEVRAGAGQIVALHKGATVRYGGTAGTQLLLAIAPVNWAVAATPDEPAESVQKFADAPKVLFLTPFHFGSAEHDDEFDKVVENLMSEYPDHEVVARHLPPFERDDATYDSDQASAVVEAVKQANHEDFDAIVIACHYDPAVQAAREVSRVPVVGPLQLTTGMTTQFGPKFAVITDVVEAEPVIQQLVERYGHGAASVGVKAIGWDGDAILDDTLGAARVVDAMVADLAARGEVQSVVIACTIVSAAYESHRDEFPDRGIVVLNSNLVTTKGAAALASM